MNMKKKMSVSTEDFSDILSNDVILRCKKSLPNKVK